MLFVNSNNAATRGEITFTKLLEIFTKRFRVKHLDQFYYSAIQNGMQYRHQISERFADRCRQLCVQTVRQLADPAQQQIFNEETKRCMLAAYTNGLSGSIGRQYGTECQLPLWKLHSLLPLFSRQRRKSHIEWLNTPGTIVLPLVVVIIMFLQSALVPIKQVTLAEIVSSEVTEW